MAAHKRASRGKKKTTKGRRCLRVKHELERVKESLRRLRSKARPRRYGPSESPARRRARLRARREEESMHSKYNDPGRRRQKTRRKGRISAYNRFVKEFFRKHPQATLRKAARAWNGGRATPRRSSRKRYGRDKTSKLRAASRRYRAFMRKQKKTWATIDQARVAWKHSRAHRKGKSRKGKGRKGRKAHR